MDRRLSDILRDKPEIITSFPVWVLPTKTVETLKAAENPAIIEVAGRDSVAAAVRAAEVLPIDAFVPTVVYTGTEYGDWKPLFDKIDFLKYLCAAKTPDLTVYDPVVLGAPGLWRVLNGRYVSLLFKRYGFWTPCVACHVYVHAVRVPLAKTVGSRIVIAGERESHGGRVKVNQISAALDAYVSLLRRFNVELVLPLRHVASDAEVKELAGGGWNESAGQLECVLGGNYRDTSGGVSYNETSVKRFLDEFAVPVVERAMKAYLARESPDYSKLAEGLI